MHGQNDRSCISNWRRSITPDMPTFAVWYRELGVQQHLGQLSYNAVRKHCAYFRPQYKSVCCRIQDAAPPVKCTDLGQQHTPTWVSNIHRLGSATYTDLGQQHTKFRPIIYQVWAFYIPSLGLLYTKFRPITYQVWAYYMPSLGLLHVKAVKVYNQWHDDTGLYITQKNFDIIMCPMQWPVHASIQCIVYMHGQCAIPSPLPSILDAYPASFDSCRSGVWCPACSAAPNPNQEMCTQRDPRNMRAFFIKAFGDELW